MPGGQTVPGSSSSETTPSRLCLSWVPHTSLFSLLCSPSISSSWFPSACVGTGGVWSWARERRAAVLRELLVSCLGTWPHSGQLRALVSCELQDAGRSADLRSPALVCEVGEPRPLNGLTRWRVGRVAWERHTHQESHLCPGLGRCRGQASSSLFARGRERCAWVLLCGPHSWGETCIFLSPSSPRRPAPSLPPSLPHSLPPALPPPGPLSHSLKGKVKTDAFPLLKGGIY